MKQTAVEWLIKEIPSVDWKNSYWENILEKAKEMEKEQIIKSVQDANATYFWVKYEGSEDYYNKTYKK